MKASLIRRLRMIEYPIRSCDRSVKTVFEVVQAPINLEVLRMADNDLGEV